MIFVTWASLAIAAPVATAITPFGWLVLGAPAALLTVPALIIESRDYFRQKWWRGP